jgi:hypothetical protein
MIWESAPWKEPLLESANYFVRVRFSERTTEKTMVRIEKEILIGFYSIRKLLDTFKVSDSTKNMKFELCCYPNMKDVDYLNRHHCPSDLFNLAKGHLESRDLRFLCDRFIHSFIFIPAGDNNRLSGFYVASDMDRKKKCYFIQLSQVLRAFRVVGRDYPTEVHFKRDPNTGELNGTTR